MNLKRTKRIAVLASIVTILFLLIAGTAGTVSANSPTDALTDTDSWRSSGPGTHDVATGDTGIEFSYDYGSYGSQTWEYETTAQTDAEFKLDWTYDGHHSWYRADADAYIEVNGDRTKLTDTGGNGAFSTSGTTKISVSKGDTVRVILQGDHFDWSRTMRGTFSITGVSRVNPEPMTEHALDSWSVSGPGTHDVATGDTDVEFSYDSDDYWWQTWEYETTAQTDADLELDWNYEGHHSWYYAAAEAYVEVNGDRTKLTDKETHGSFSASGTTEISVKKGDTVRVILEGRHWDWSKIMRGTFEATFSRENPPRRTLQGPSSQAQPIYTKKPTADEKEGTNDPAVDVTGDTKLLVILATFDDTTPKYDKQAYKNLFFGTNPSETAGPGSVREYFNEASDGKLNYQDSEVVGWIKSDYTRQQAIRKDASYTVGAKFVENVVQKADQRINLKDYDSNNNNRLDVVVVHQGKSFQETRNSDDFKHIGETRANIKLKGITVEGYALVPEEENGGITSVGSIAHEMGHVMFHWGDLYKKNNIEGGSWALMGYGKFGVEGGGSGRYGESPVHPVSWRKNRLGWGTSSKINIRNGEAGILPPASKVNDFYFMANGYNISYRPSHLGTFDQGQMGLKRKAPQYYSGVVGSPPDDPFVGVHKWRTNVGSKNGADGVNSGFVKHEFRTSNIHKKPIAQGEEALLINDPARRTLQSGREAAYAVDVSGTHRVDSRVSWKTGKKDMTVELYNPSGSLAVSSKQTGISYTSVQTASDSPSKGGWKLVEKAGNSDVTYHTATNYERAPLPTRLENVDGSNGPLDAGTTAAPNDVELNIRAYSGDQSYSPWEGASLDPSQFTVTLDGIKLPASDISVDTDAGKFPTDNSIQLQVELPKSRQPGQFDLSVQFTDAKHGVQHTTEPLTAKVNYYRSVRRSLTVDGNTEITAGETVTMEAEITNPNPSKVTQTVDLRVPGLGVVDSREIEIEGGGSTTETFSFSTDPGDAGQYTAQVGPEGSRATQSFELTDPEPANFELDLLEESEEVYPWEDAEVTVRVTNTGGKPDSQVIRYRLGGDDCGYQGGEDSEGISLDPGESETVVLRIDTYSGSMNRGCDGDTRSSGSVVSEDNDVNAGVDLKKYEY